MRVQSLASAPSCPRAPLNIAGPRHLEILMHALGMTTKSQGSRNHYVCGEGGQDHRDCVELVAQGLMARHAPSALTGGEDCFTVTQAGRAYALANRPPEPRLTRSQRRYVEYLDADGDMRFGEWLKSRGHSRERS